MRLLCPDLIGRDDVVAELLATLDLARTGAGGVVVLSGAAGLGKTRLVDHVTGVARQRGLRTLRGRANESDVRLGLRPFAEALTAAVRSDGSPDDEDFAPFQPILAGLVPQWGVRPPEEPASSMFIAEGVLRFLRQAGRGRGALLVIEDAHWADSDSVTVIEYLADHLVTEPAAVVVTVRESGPSSAIEWAAKLTARRAAVNLRLTPLDRGDVRRMIRSCLGQEPPAELVEAVVDRADGVPFLVEELLAGIADVGGLVRGDLGWRVDPDRIRPGVPVSLAASVRARLTSLGEPARVVLGAAATLGVAFDWRLLTGMTGRSDLEVGAALRAAGDAQLTDLVAGTDEVRFRHALTRDAVLESLTPPERASLAAAGLAELARRDPDLSGDSVVVAAELAARAGDRRRSATLYLEAGRRLLEAGELADAVRALERGRDLAEAARERHATTVVLVEALMRAGRAEQVISVGAPLLEATPAEDATTRVRLLVLLVRGCVVAANWPAAHRYLDQLDGLVDAPTTVRAEARALRAAVAFGEHRFADAETAAHEALARAGDGAHATRAMAHLILGRSQRFRDFVVAEQSLREARAIAEAHGLPGEAMAATFELAALHYIRSGDIEPLAGVREIAARVGALGVVGVADLQLAVRLAIGHRLDEALAAAGAVEHHARRYGLGGLVSSALVVRGFCLAVRGDTDEVARVVAELDPRTVDDREHRSYLWAYVRLILAVALDDLAAAWDAAERARELLVDNTSHALGMWVLLRTLSGWSVERAVAAAGLTDAMQPLCRAAVRAATAVSQGRAGQPDAALSTYAEVEAILRDAPWCRHLFRRLVAGAAGADGWTFPVVWTAESADFFTAEGLPALARACHALVGRPPASGALPARLNRFGLTERESDVLLLLVEGLSNRQIAERLRVSPRTIEKHVERLLQKTGAANRSALVALALRADP